MTKVEMYQFVERLENLTCFGQGNLPYKVIYGDEFRKLRQIMNFFYTHATENV